MTADERLEEDRLRVLAGYDILGSPPEPEFDEITRLAALVIDVPSSAISLIDDRRQWFKARIGIDFEETPRDQAFCAHAVAARDFLEITDARLDPRFAANPLVTCDNGIRFYAGAPLILESGFCLGTLCVFDSVVRTPLSLRQRQALKDLARLAVDRIEKRKERIASEIAAKVVDAASDAVLAVGTDGIIRFWNPAAERMFGTPASEAVGNTLDMILPETAMAAAHHRGFARAVAGGRTSLVGTAVELTARRASGQEFPIELSLARWNGEGRAGDGGFAAIVRDITERRALEQDRAGARAFLDTIIAHMPAMLFVKDSVTRQYVFLNRAGEDLIGRPASEVVGRTDRELFPETGDAFHDRDTSALKSEAVESFESEFSRDDGGSLILRTKRIVIDAPIAGDKYILGLTEDVTDLRQTEARVLYLALHDTLTGLGNRTNFVEQLARLVAARSSLAILTIDLDRFKAVNDQFGHLIGDRVLIEVAARLRRIAAQEDLVARIGGDEFAMILNSEDAAIRAARIAGMIVTSMSEPFPIDRLVAHIGASIGIVVAPEDGESVETLRQAADLALYRAKSLGRGAIAFYSSDLDNAASERRLLEIDLRKAIEDGEITVAFQPVIACRTAQVSSFEALARWTHPRLGPIRPDVFIAIAEESGLIATLGAHVMKTACTAAAGWHPDIRVAVNLSPMQFDAPDLIDRIGEILGQSGLAPNRLQLEITEGLVIRDVDNTFRVLAELRALGVQILMDDFGVGYSSLSYFERFPFDKVKIDRSFISKIATSPAAKAIVEAVVGLGKALGMGTVAEGVETEEQMMMLTELGVSHLQGYLFSEPKPEAAFAHIVHYRQASLPIGRSGVEHR